MPDLKLMNARALTEALRLLGGDGLLNVVQVATDALDRAERTGYEEAREHAQAEYDREADTDAVYNAGYTAGEVDGYDKGFEHGEAHAHFLAGTKPLPLHGAASAIDREMKQEPHQLEFEFGG